MPTAAQILIGRERQYQGTLFDATRTSAPLFNALEAYEMEGTSFLTMAKTGLPTATGFGRLDEGWTSSQNAYTMGKVEAKFIQMGVKEPVKSTDLYDQAHQKMITARELLAWVPDQIQDRAKVELFNIEKQIIKGASNDADGFVGLKEATPATSGNKYTAATFAPEADEYTRTAYDAEGSTLATGSSVYLIHSGIRGVNLRMGGPTGLDQFLEFSEVVKQFFPDPADATKTLQYYFSEASGYIGMSIFGSSEGTNRTFYQRCAVRAYNVTADSGKTCTEALLDKLWEMLPPENRSSLMYVMNGRSLRQLRDSKTSSSRVTVMMSPGDAAMNRFTTLPELPETHRGIPIVTVSNEVIPSTETLV